MTVEAPACTSQDVTPVVHVEESSSYEEHHSLNGLPFEGTAVTTEGNHEYVVTAVDSSGNSGAGSASFVIDRTAPEITVSGVADGSVVRGPVTPSIAIDDANLTSSSATLNGAPYSSGTPITAEGEYTLEVTASDCAGNDATFSMSFVIDLTAPVITLGAPACTNANVTPQVTVDELHPGTLVMRLDGMVFTGGMVTGEGEHLLEVTAADVAGNEASAATVFIIDRTAPSIVVTGVVDGQQSEPPVTPIVTFQDAHLITSGSTLDGQPFASGTTVTTEGSHTLVASAADCAGNLATTTVSFELEDSQAMPCGMIGPDALGPYGGYACTLPQGVGTVVVFDQAQLDDYLTNFGFDGTKVRNLNIKFNPTGAIEVRTPCRINLAGLDGVLHVEAESLYLSGALGVSVAEDYAAPDMGVDVSGDITLASSGESAGFFKGLTIDAGRICVQAHKEAKIGELSNVTANGIEVISTGDLTSSNALVRENTVVNANSLLVRASRSARLGDGTTIEVTGPIVVESTGAYVLSTAHITQGAQVSSNALSLVSGNHATLGPSVVVDVDGLFHMNAQTAAKCSIASSTVITAGTRSGNCLP